MSDLPHGWVKQYDQNTGHLFFVDTLATPPRSIWTHPYEDEQYLLDHPEVREKLRKDDLPPSFEEATRPHSYHAYPAESSAGQHSYSDPHISQQTKHKRGFFGKMKDKAKGTKEEPMAAKYRDREEHRRPVMDYGPQSYASPANYHTGNRNRGLGTGGMGMGLPILGGLAGGLLLGDMLGGGFGDGGFGGGFGGGF